ncbi:alpha/beta fold family hydrolase [Penicillium coprophilum]|uniref:alpha/beta fold family hydrolase n=1 Tax=Penicillium coprophilum TaxID=36646 RepID=UPI002399385A|nr:alpha/beta fold family hydrolase [Penicillium coprophilum]KAJ5171399.1 alpha/beta fold family hydrolase [Penicillium coprophilum]
MWKVEHYLAILETSHFGNTCAIVISACLPVLFAASGDIDLPTGVAQVPFVAGNTSLPLSERLEALQSAFFVRGHDAHVWLDGWYHDVLAMEHAAVEKYGSLKEHWAGGDNTQVLELIPAEDPFQPSNQWNVTSTRYPERATSVIIADATYALFPEQPRAVVEAALPWLKQQSSKL